ncbi:uncharacterized protein [Argopecten irradians]|uniref:uncharacterized protein isoform X2 n=1 Tax=Argopecten irradians TaxID=31199 RepID=UPI00372277BB
MVRTLWIKMLMSRKNLFSAFAFICFFTVTGVWIQFKSIFSQRAYIFRNLTRGIKAETRPYLLDSYDDIVDESGTGLAYLRRNAGTWRQKAAVFQPQPPRLQNRMMTIGIPTIQRTRE